MPSISNFSGLADNETKLEQVTEAVLTAGLCAASPQQCKGSRDGSHGTGSLQYTECVGKLLTI